MRFATLAIALSALTAISATANTASDASTNAQLIARSGGPVDSSSRMTKRQIVQSNLKRKHKRGTTGNCKPRSIPPQVPLEPPVLVKDPPKEPEAKPTPEPQPMPQEPEEKPQENNQQEPPKQPEPPKQGPAKEPEQPPKQEPPKQEPPKQDPPPPPPPSGGNADAKLGRISAFQGQNGPGILSWFYTNHGGDSTNGESWCQTRYKVGRTCIIYKKRDLVY